MNKSSVLALVGVVRLADLDLPGVVADIPSADAVPDTVLIADLLVDGDLPIRVDGQKLLGAQEGAAQRGIGSGLAFAVLRLGVVADHRLIDAVPYVFVFTVPAGDALLLYPRVPDHHVTVTDLVSFHFLLLILGAFAFDCTLIISYC